MDNDAPMRAWQGESISLDEVLESGSAPLIGEHFKYLGVAGQKKFIKYWNIIEKAWRKYSGQLFQDVPDGQLVMDMLGKSQQKGLMEVSKAALELFTLQYTARLAYDKKYPIYIGD